MDTISLAVRAIPPAARHRRAQSAKRRLASALGAPRLTRSNSGSSSQSSGSYFSACTSASGSTGAGGMPGG